MKIVLETERLYLREFTINDITDLSEILQDIEVMYAWEHSFSDEEVTNWFNKNSESYIKNGFSFWAVIHKKTNKLLGYCGITIQKITGNDLLEIGYSLKKIYWHNGYATEAASGCKNYAFETLKAEKIYSIIRENNISSQNVAKRIGMKQVDEVIKQYYNMDMLHYIFQINKYGAA